MSQSISDKIKSMVGCKIFREVDEDTIEVYRIKKYSNSENAVVCVDEDGNLKYLDQADLKKYHILSADGMLMASIVKVKAENGRVFKDVIVSVSKVLEIQSGMFQPYAICRQSINDIFYNLMSQGEDDTMAGLAVNRDDCPAGFDMGMMMAADEIVKSEVVYFYRKDTLEDIYPFLKIKDYDKVLSDLYTTHVNTVKNIDPTAMMKKEHAGWCKNLKLLLEQNNFQSDINQMLGITDVTFNLEDYIVETPLPDESKGGYYTVPDDLKLWLSGAFRIAINDLTVLEYDHDINLADLNNARYFFLRDNQKKLYICVYTITGEYLQSDLEDQYNKASFIDEWRIDFVDKYKKSRGL